VLVVSLPVSEVACLDRGLQRASLHHRQDLGTHRLVWTPRAEADAARCPLIAIGHWKHLRTTNAVESPFAAVRLRTAAAKRFKKVESATAVIWKTLLVAEQSGQRLDAPELLPEVAEAVAHVNGERANRDNEKAAA
jgi:hypothetical protein